MLLARLLRELGVTRGRWLLAGLYALVPKILDYGTNGYADLPVAAAGAAVLLLLVSDSSPLAVGLAAGCAASLKNEGLVVAAAAFGFLGWRVARRRVSNRAFGAAALACAAVVLPWQGVVFTHGLPAHTQAFSPGQLLGPGRGRALIALEGAALEALGPGVTLPALEQGAPAWPLWLPAQRDGWVLLWFAVGAALLVRFRELWAPRRRIVTGFLAFLAAVFVLVYAGSGYNLPWLLVTSLDRILVQLSPAAFALACAAAFAPRRNR